MSENQKLREVLQHAIEDLSSATGFLTGRSRERQSKTVEALAKLQADIIALPTANHLPDAGKMVEPSQHHRDSKELRSLCQARDEARKQRDLCQVEIAGLKSAVGYLSAMVDEQTRLVQKAVQAMKALHDTVKPDDGPEMNAIIPYEAFHVFVDTHAELLFALKHGPQITKPPQPVGERLTLSAEDVHAAFVKHFPKTRISQAWIGFAAEIAEAIAARAAPSASDAVDAQRYRWLREQHWSNSDICCVDKPKQNVRLGGTCPSGDLLDSAIDAQL